MKDVVLKFNAKLAKSGVDWEAREISLPPMKLPFSWDTLHVLEAFAGITVEVTVRSQTLPLGANAKQADQSDDLAPVSDEAWAKLTGLRAGPATTEAIAPEPLVNSHSLMLTAMPDKYTSAGELKYKKVERILGKIWGEKVPEVRARLDSAPGKPFNVIGKGSLEFVLETKAKLEERGAACEIVEWLPTTKAMEEAIEAATPPADVPESAFGHPCMECDESGMTCKNVAKWRTNPEMVEAGHSDGIWCDEHKQDDDVPLAEARLVVGIDVANGTDASAQQPALFDGAPPPPTTAEMDERDAEWMGEPGDHRGDEALVG